MKNIKLKASANFEIVSHPATQLSWMHFKEHAKYYGYILPQNIHFLLAFVTKMEYNNLRK